MPSFSFRFSSKTTGVLKTIRSVYGRIHFEPDQQLTVCCNVGPRYFVSIYGLLNARHQATYAIPQ